MADLFGGVPAPRLNYNPAEDSDSFNRAWAGGMALGQRKRAQNFEEAQAKYVREKYEQQRVETFHYADELAAEMKQYGGVETVNDVPGFMTSNPRSVLHPIKGKLFADYAGGLEAIEKVKTAAANTAAEKERLKLASIGAQAWLKTKQELMQYDPITALHISQTETTDGLPSPDTYELLDRIHPDFTAWREKQKYLTPPAIVAGIRSDTETAKIASREAIAFGRNAMQLEINQSNLDSKAKDRVSRTLANAYDVVGHSLIEGLKGEIRSVLKIDNNTERQNTLSRVIDEWDTKIAAEKAKSGSTAEPDAPAKAIAGKIVIQGGSRFSIDADGNATYLGPAK